ncbi:MAG: YjgP/YjgQ family permease [Planctomycetes bacterium]|nr:YjgP/YjgQ family permease [Planctomycetota bacterium]
MPKRFYGYIFRELVEALIIAFGAYTFVMILGAMFKPLQAGFGVITVLNILPYAMPTVFPWSVPISVLTACVIAYGRLSSDNEIVAINSLGTSPVHIVAPAIILACVVAVPMLYCNHFFEPRSHQMRKAAFTDAMLSSPFSLLRFEEPVFEVSGVKIYIGEAKENRLKNIFIFREKDVVKEDENGKLVRSPGEVQLTYAAAATYEIVGDGANRELQLTLHDVVFKFISRDEPYGYNYMQCDTTTETISLAERAFVPGWKDMTTPELLNEIKKYTGPNAEPISEQRLNGLLTRVRMRWSSAFNVISLALLGVPLGILTRKGRKLVGFGVSVLVVIVLYIPLVFCGKALSNNGWFMAPLWPWASVVVVAALGLLLIRRQIRV